MFFSPERGDVTNVTEGSYPDKLKFVAPFTARALSFQPSTVTPGIGVAMRPPKPCASEIRFVH